MIDLCSIRRSLALEKFPHLFAVLGRLVNFQSKGHILAITMGFWYLQASNPHEVGMLHIWMGEKGGGSEATVAVPKLLK